MSFHQFFFVIGKKTYEKPCIHFQVFNLVKNYLSNINNILKCLMPINSLKRVNIF